MPSGSTVVITYDGTDITSHVLFSNATFESQLNAQPGTFEITCKDLTQSLSFTTGKEIVFTLDGVRLYGGYLTQVTRTFALPVVDTTEIADVTQREWVLRGVDYNILFDKRVIRNTSDYLESLPTFTKSSYDGDLIRTLCSTYLDIPAGFDTSTYVQNIVPPFDPLNQGTSGTGTYMQQGTTWRAQMEDFAQFSGAIWYIDANKNLIYRRLEDSAARWGFSDVPNNLAISAPQVYQGATIGFRELDITEDGSTIVNDALVWGGSAFGSTTGGTFFARAENSTSEGIHGHWQFGDSNHLGNPGYASQAGVTAVANVIVTGDPTQIDPATGRGLVYPQFSCRLSWFGHDVPKLSGTANHLRPGDLVTMVFFSLKDPDHPAAFIQTLPVRQIEVAFPTIDKNGKGYVKFSAFFGLQATDPYTLWRYLLQRNRLDFAAQINAAVPTADNTTTSPTFGSYGQFQVTPTPNGTNKVFNLPNAIGYIAGTSTVFVDGMFVARGDGYSESDPPNGEITFDVAPHAGADIWVVCYTTGAIAGAQ